MRAAAFAALALAVPAVLPPLARPAAADTTMAADAPTAPAVPVRHELRLGTMMGGGDVGDAHGFSGGLVASVALRRRDLALIAELHYLGIGDDLGRLAPRRGRATEGALLARWNVLSGAPDAPLAGALWLEGGAGYQHVGWNAGGVLDRPFAALGFGTELDAGTGPRARRQHLGPFIALRSQIAHGPPSTAMPTCGGPCSRATRPSATDVSIYVMFGLHTGR